MTWNILLDMEKFFFDMKIFLLVMEKFWLDMGNFFLDMEFFGMSNFGTWCFVDISMIG